MRETVGALVRMRDGFVAAIWRQRVAWICEGINELGAGCDRIWPNTYNNGRIPCRQSR